MLSVVLCLNVKLCTSGIVALYAYEAILLPVFLKHLKYPFSDIQGKDKSNGHKLEYRVFNLNI